MRQTKSLKEIIFFLIIFLSSTTIKTKEILETAILIEEGLSASNLSEDKQAGNRVPNYSPSFISYACFLEPRSDTIERLTRASNYFLEVTRYGYVPLYTLYEKFAIALGQTLAKANYEKKTFNLLKELESSVIKDDQDKFPRLNQKESTPDALLENNRLFFESRHNVVELFLQKVRKHVEDEKFSIFVRNSFLKYFKYIMQVEYIKLSPNQCLLVEDILIDGQELFDNITPDSRNNEELFHPEKCKIERLNSTTTIHGRDFFNKGIAVAFFNYQSLTDLKKMDTPKIILETLVNGKNIFTYTVSEKNDFVKNKIHFKTINGNKTVDFSVDEDDKTKCSEPVFTFLSIQPDLNFYKFFISLRFPTLNVNKMYITQIPANLIEKLQINVFNFFRENAYKYLEFNYQLENEYKIIMDLIQKENLYNFLVKSSAQCQQSNCKFIDDGKCTACKDKFMLFNGECLTNCPSTHYKVEHPTNPSKIKCEKCDKTCNTCNSKDECLTCSKDYPLKEGNKCVLECNKGFYVDPKNKSTCTKCLEECQTCENGTECLTCKNEKFLNEQNRCVECKEGKLKVIENGVLKCVECPSNCAQCLDPKTCTKCSGKFLLTSDNQCADCCQKGFFEKDNKCVPCDVECAECKNESTCTLCKNPNANLANGQCNKVCDCGYSNNNGVCTKCLEENCERCSFNPFNQCERCDTGFALKNSKCVKDCGEGFELVTVGEITECKPCNDNCSVCKNGKCIKCVENKFFLFNQCVDCPTGYTPCNGSCSKCPNTDCDKCNCKNIHECVFCQYGFL